MQIRQPTSVALLQRSRHHLPGTIFTPIPGFRPLGQERDNARNPQLNCFFQKQAIPFLLLQQCKALPSVRERAPPDVYVQK